jgi:SNF2 family DNA or RNA helicase
MLSLERLASKDIQPLDMRTLRFELEDDDRVIITPSNEVSTDAWRAVVLFWSTDIANPLAIRQLDISIADFVDKAAWIRDVWRRGGGEGSISPEVMKLAKKYKDGSQAFRILRTLNTKRHTNQVVEVPNLLLTRTLTARQQENILYLLDMENGANFSVPGAGKTLTALCVWQILKKRGVLGRILVVCPRSAFEAWQLEPIDFFGQTGITEIYSGRILNENTEICLVNYEQLENVHRLSYLRQWIIQNEAGLIIDEAHRIKAGRNSVRWISVHSLSTAAKRVDILTGTPMPQGPQDLKALFSVAWPKISKLDLDERTLPLLSRNSVFVRTTKGELNLPKADLVTVVQEPDKLQKEILEALQDRYIGINFLSISDAKNLAKRGRAIMTMLAAATNPGLLAGRKEFSQYEFGFSWPPKAIADDKQLTDIIEEYMRHEIPWKFRYVALRAEELSKSGEKVLIWSNFVGNLASLKGILKKFQPAVVYGSVSAEDRENELARFRTDPNCTVLLSNPQTLGEGVSLHQVCHNEIFVDRSYNAGLYLQAVDRIHRLGLSPEQKTTIEILVSKGTIDERVSVRLATKINALSKFLQDEHLVETAIPQGDELSPEDVIGLSDDDFEDIAGYWKA